MQLPSFFLKKFYFKVMYGLFINIKWQEEQKIVKVGERKRERGSSRFVGLEVDFD